jgi:hypothetical protein
MRNNQLDTMMQLTHGMLILLNQIKNMTKLRLSFFCISFFMYFLLLGCQNTASNYAPGNSQYGNPAVHNQTTIGKEEVSAGNDSIINPQNNPTGMRKANADMSGTGESGHATATRPPAPANDPNNKAQPDTIKYK